MSKELLVLLPAYNEASNIEILVERWQAQEEELCAAGLQLRLLLVDDGSIDRTEEICHHLNNTYANFSFIKHKENKGLGKAVQTGIGYALTSCPECAYLVVMDCDNTHDPKYVLTMLKHIGTNPKADVVIASRYRKGSRVFGVPLYRFFLSFGARFVYTLTLGLENVRDYTCGYRLYRIHALHEVSKAFKDTLIEERGFTCMVELLYKMFLSGSTFSEIPFELHYEDKLGQSKMKVTQTTLKSLALIKKLRKIK